MTSNSMEHCEWIRYFFCVYVEMNEHMCVCLCDKLQSVNIDNCQTTHTNRLISCFRGFIVLLAWHCGPHFKHRFYALVKKQINCLYI